VNSCDLRFPAYDAVAQHAAIRWTLFADRDVVDVLPTLHRDTLRLRHRGDADPAGWRTVLTAAGFPAPEVEAAPLAPASASRRAG
jgi:hypothetical protein